ncbi:hypothetical protein Vadar_025169 [Vaccinium darrowii]|uniref:Uncharacterized protein n=1 Tax=Vaccinium darrowii TaxID=229202 RepID=A0ACB7X3R7_9ERIC|nr:hypothetical protein Vadar_025169 [Vaccinium darrowii]
MRSKQCHVKVSPPASWMIEGRKVDLLSWLVSPMMPPTPTFCVRHWLQHHGKLQGTPWHSSWKALLSWQAPSRRLFGSNLRENLRTSLPRPRVRSAAARRRFETVAIPNSALKSTILKWCDKSGTQDPTAPDYGSLENAVRAMKDEEGSTQSLSLRVKPSREPP